jgi:SAM-dependent methyltransferase
MPALRPFYGDYAWAFDLLIDRPVAKECAVIIGWLLERGVRPGAEILDAGCGTGRYARELARRGYIVHGIDASAELLNIARQSIGDEPLSVSYAVGDILLLPRGRYDAILCRGVLNDLADDDSRAAVFGSFARALRRAGVLILDVREWLASAERKAREPVFLKRVATDCGELTFTSVTRLDPPNRRLILDERHTLIRDGIEQSSDYQFMMQCWTHGELESSLTRNGFGTIAYFGAYDAAVPPGSTDRLVAISQLSETRAGG